MAELCQEFGIVNSQLHKWKKALLDGGAEVFKGTSKPQQSANIGILKIKDEFFD